MSGFFRLTVTEFKLFLRDGASLFVVLGIPLGLLLIFGSMVAGADPSANPRIDVRASEGFFSALAVALALAMLGLFTIPTYLGTYREKGILRRLATTPLHPALLLGAQLVVHMVVALVGTFLVIFVGNLAFQIRAPQNLPGFLLAFILSASALFTLGLVIAALAPSGRAAGGIGSLLNFPLLFFAGVWLPRQQMPAWLGRIADFTPLHAAMEAFWVTWQGSAPPPLALTVLGVLTLLFGVVAAQTFRWE